MELTYVTTEDVMMVVSVETAAQPMISEPALFAHLSELHLVTSRPAAPGEPLHDGHWLAVHQAPEEYQTTQIHVVQNWFEELKRKLAGRQ